jgi:hypothetical protein
MWAEIYEARLNWARRGHDRVIAGLSDQTRASMPRIGEGAVTVVLYGPTQVGKTTLLLTLLGIDEVRRPDVDKVLRGERAHGKSSTAMAMRYERSADEQWRLRVNGCDEALDGAKLYARLAELRTAMMRNEAGNEPAVVGIPTDYFAPQARALPDIRILDLPGGGALNPVEAAYAKRVGGYHLHHGDLVLLVGRRNALGFLNPNDFTLPGIRDWRYTPERFLIVTTRSFSLDSVAKWLRQAPVPTLKALRSTLLQDIASHRTGLETLPGLEQRCFPLEFGDSWDKLKQAEPELYAKAALLKAELLAELHEKLTVAAQPVNRLRRMHQTHEAVARIRAKEFLKRWDIQRRKRIGVRKARDRAMALQESLAKAQAEARAIPADSELKRIKQALQDGMIKVMKMATEKLIAIARGDKQKRTRVYLLQQAETCRSQLFRTVTMALEDEFAPDLDEKAPDSYINMIMDLQGLATAEFEKAQTTLQLRIDDALRPFIKRIKEYWFESYLIDRNFQKDCAELSTAQHATRDIMLDFAASACTKALETLTTRCRGTREEAEANIAALGAASRFAASKADAREKLCREHARETLAYARRTRQDKIHAQTYRTIMDEELAEELRTRRLAFREKAEPNYRFLQLLGGLAVCSAARDLRDHR